MENKNLRVTFKNRVIFANLLKHNLAQALEIAPTLLRYKNRRKTLNERFGVVQKEHFKNKKGSAGLPKRSPFKLNRTKNIKLSSLKGKKSSKSCTEMSQTKIIGHTKKWTLPDMAIPAKSAGKTKMKKKVTFDGTATGEIMSSEMELELDLMDEHLKCISDVRIQPSLDVRESLESEKENYRKEIMPVAAANVQVPSVSSDLIIQPKESDIAPTAAIHALSEPLQDMHTYENAMTSALSTEKAQRIDNGNVPAVEKLKDFAGNDTVVTAEDLDHRVTGDHVDHTMTTRPHTGDAKKSEADCEFVTASGQDVESTEDEAKSSVEIKTNDNRQNKDLKSYVKDLKLPDSSKTVDVIKDSINVGCRQQSQHGSPEKFGKIKHTHKSCIPRVKTVSVTTASRNTSKHDKRSIGKHTTSKLLTKTSYAEKKPSARSKNMQHMMKSKKCKPSEGLPPEAFPLNMLLPLDGGTSTSVITSREDTNQADTTCGVHVVAKQDQSLVSKVMEQFSIANPKKTIESVPESSIQDTCKAADFSSPMVPQVQSATVTEMMCVSEATEHNEEFDFQQNLGDTVSESASKGADIHIKIPNLLPTNAIDLSPIPSPFLAAESRVRASNRADKTTAQGSKDSLIPSQTFSSFISLLTEKHDRITGEMLHQVEECVGAKPIKSCTEGAVKTERSTSKAHKVKDKQRNQRRTRPDTAGKFHGRTLLTGKEVPPRYIPLDPLYRSRPIKKNGEKETIPFDPRIAHYAEKRPQNLRKNMRSTSEIPTVSNSLGKDKLSMTPVLSDIPEVSMVDLSPMTRINICKKQNFASMLASYKPSKHVGHNGTDFVSLEAQSTDHSLTSKAGLHDAMMNDDMDLESPPALQRNKAFQKHELDYSSSPVRVRHCGQISLEGIRAITDIEFVGTRSSMEVCENSPHTEEETRIKHSSEPGNRWMKRKSSTTFDSGPRKSHCGEMHISEPSCTEKGSKDLQSDGAIMKGKPKVIGHEDDSSNSQYELWNLLDDMADHFQTDKNITGNQPIISDLSPSSGSNHGVAGALQEHNLFYSVVTEADVQNNKGKDTTHRMKNGELPSSLGSEMSPSPIFLSKDAVQLLKSAVGSAYSISPVRTEGCAMADMSSPQVTGEPSLTRGMYGQAASIPVLSSNLKKGRQEGVHCVKITSPGNGSHMMCERDDSSNHQAAEAPEEDDIAIPVISTLRDCSTMPAIDATQLEDTQNHDSAVHQCNPSGLLRVNHPGCADGNRDGRLPPEDGNSHLILPGAGFPEQEPTPDQYSVDPWSSEPSASNVQHLTTDIDTKYQICDETSKTPTSSPDMIGKLDGLIRECRENCNTSNSNASDSKPINSGSSTISDNQIETFIRNCKESSQRANVDGDTQCHIPKGLQKGLCADNSPRKFADIDHVQSKAKENIFDVFTRLEDCKSNKREVAVVAPTLQKKYEGRVTPNTNAGLCIINSTVESPPRTVVLSSRQTQFVSEIENIIDLTEENSSTESKDPCTTSSKVCNDSPKLQRRQCSPVMESSTSKVSSMIDSRDHRSHRSTSPQKKHKGKKSSVKSFKQGKRSGRHTKSPTRRSRSPDKGSSRSRTDKATRHMPLLRECKSQKKKSHKHRSSSHSHTGSRSRSRHRSGFEYSRGLSPRSPSFESSRRSAIQHVPFMHSDESSNDSRSYDGYYIRDKRKKDHHSCKDFPGNRNIWSEASASSSFVQSRKDHGFNDSEREATRDSSTRGYMGSDYRPVRDRGSPDRDMNCYDDWYNTRTHSSYDDGGFPDVPFGQSYDQDDRVGFYTPSDDKFGGKPSIAAYAPGQQ